MQIYLLESLGKFTRIYGERLGTLQTKTAEYSVYMDYKGGEWLHAYYKPEDKYYLLPFIRLGSGEEYLEYLKHI